MSGIFFTSADEILVAIKEASDGIKAGVFEGVITVSKGDVVTVYVRNGTVENRLATIDSMFGIMYKMRETGEPNITAFRVFMEEAYKRFKHYFGKYGNAVNLSKFL